MQFFPSILMIFAGLWLMVCGWIFPASTLNYPRLFKGGTLLLGLATFNTGVYLFDHLIMG